jgi:argininosuccinate lyase
MDIRGRRLEKPNERATRFISSISTDAAIAEEVLRVNLAHMVSLVHNGEVERETGAKCLRFLASAKTEFDQESLTEDFHQLLEQQAVDSLGVEVAGYLNLGKSRNDQVATAIRMHLRTELLDTIDAAIEFQTSLIVLARRWGKVVFPGYTHLQHAQPVTLSHHLFAWFDRTQRDIERILELYVRADKSPMGAAALAGTSVRIDRREVASLLGFEGLVGNSIDAVSSRDIELEALSCLAIAMNGLSRTAEELVLWNTKEFSFVDLPDQFAATSSIMPQKKNAVVAEMVRAKSGSVIGDLAGALAIVKALPYSYDLDLQEVTPHLWNAVSMTTDSFKLIAEMLRKTSFNEEAIEASSENDMSTATSLANYLVSEHALSFREAHAIVGALSRKAASQGKTLEVVATKSLPIISREICGKAVTIEAKTLSLLLDPAASLNAIHSEGGANPTGIPGGIGSRTSAIRMSLAVVKKRRSALSSSEQKLRRTVRATTREVKN